MNSLMVSSNDCVHDFDMSKEILKDIDFEPMELLLDSLVGSASKKN